MKSYITLLLFLIIPSVLFSQANNNTKPSIPDRHKTVSYQNNKRQAQIIDTVLFTNAIISYANDTLLYEIKGTTNQIAKHTSPKLFFGIDTDKSSNYIGLLAMFFGFWAALFALLGFVFQKKSADSLKEIQPKRLPYDIFAEKIYKQILTLDVLIEIEESDCTETLREERRIGYNSIKLLEGMRMPDDLIDLSCYEKYKGEKGYEIYKKAYEIIFQWRNFNTTLNEVINNYSNRLANNILLEQYRKLRYENVLLFNTLSDFENAFRKVNKKEEKSYLSINSKKEFFINVLNKYVSSIHTIFNLSYNPKIFDNSPLCGEEEIKFPPFSEIVAKDWKLSLYERLIYFWIRLTTKKDKERIMFEIRTRKSDKAETAIKQILYNLYKKRNELRQPNNQLKTIIVNTEDYPKENSFTLPVDIYTIFNKWEDGYFKQKNKIDEPNVNFLLKIIHALEVSKMQTSLINIHDPFYIKENKYFEEKVSKYSSFGFFYSNGVKHNQKYLTLYKILCAIVAEQTLNITVTYLQNWNYHNHVDGVPAWIGDHLTDNPLKVLDGDNIIPLLDKLKITDKGKVVISTIDELKKCLENIPDNILFEEITDPRAYLNQLKEWAKSKYNILPYKK